MTALSFEGDVVDIDGGVVDLTDDDALGWLLAKKGLATVGLLEMPKIVANKESSVELVEMVASKESVLAESSGRWSTLALLSSSTTRSGRWNTLA